MRPVDRSMRQRIRTRVFDATWGGDVTFKMKEIYPSSHTHGSGKMGPSNISFLSMEVIFHFHDYRRKGKGNPFLPRFFSRVPRRRHEVSRAQLLFLFGSEKKIHFPLVVKHKEFVRSNNLQVKFEVT